MTKNKTILATCLALALSASLLSGCVYLVIGSIGAVGGYVVSPDTVEGVTQNDFETVVDSSIEVISVMGTILEQHADSGVIISKIHGSKVTITVSSITKETTKLSVKARKAFFPRISIAQDVFVKIMSYVNE